MNDQSKTPDEGHVQCTVCLKEIPTSEAKSEEAEDYIAHFCGLDCYEQWKEQSDTAQVEKD